MTGAPLTEDDVRSHLHAVLDEVDATPRPFAELHRAVATRRRNRRLTGGIAAAAILGAGVRIGLTYAGGPDAGRADKLVPAHPVDPVPALRAYVAAHHGTSPTTPLRGPDGGIYAADLEAGKVHVLSFAGQSWFSVAEPGSPLPGPPLVAVRRGPEDVGPGAVAFQVDVAGGDAVLNGILVGAGAGWDYADFDCGTTRVACAGDGNNATKYQVDGTEVDHIFHSEPNTCAPSCVAGTRYDVTWRWDSTYGVFVVGSAVKRP